MVAHWCATDDRNVPGSNPTGAASKLGQVRLPGHSFCVFRKCHYLAVQHWSLLSKRSLTGGKHVFDSQYLEKNNSVSEINPSCVTVIPQMGCLKYYYVSKQQTCHNFLGGIRILSVKICINPYHSSMHRCIATFFTLFVSRRSL